MRTWTKRLLLGLVVILVVIQFIRPAKNLSADNTNELSSKYVVPDSVMTLLKAACYDCHSNYTRYPWYAEIQPVGWWLANHVNEGKRELNFSAFTNRRIAIQNKKLEEIAEIVKEGEMPLGSYTWIHRDAVLSEAQRMAITQWAQSVQDSIRAHYPADSLVLPRRPRK